MSDECPHNEDRANCAVGCGDRAGGEDELYQYTVTNGSHARAFRFPASGADLPRSIGVSAVVRFERPVMGHPSRKST